MPAESVVFENWMRMNNVEALVCWLPTFPYDEVINDRFVITAWGNDMVVLNIWTTFTNGWDQSPFTDLGVLAFIRGGLAQARAQEAAGCRAE